ncbi:hypothetical protein LKMONMHP_3999 [Methylobacterium organophilum]|uniref:Uncharacterized protein n=2 Tax=Methylobacterium organophilum TaxID=410 RepID=A0ABQ4TGG1_METOR|nr:hypothetical protein LKMONMHP_3999 [Methylobacterium organophilum]
MKVFQVRQGASGAILWTGAAAGEIQALDAMAHEAGYYDHSDLPASIREGGLSVEALGFSKSTGSPTRRVEGGRSGHILRPSSATARAARV